MVKTVKFKIKPMFAVGEHASGMSFLVRDVVYEAQKISLPDDNNKYRFIITSPMKHLDVQVSKQVVEFVG